jgi:hypothetical protein
MIHPDTLQYTIEVFEKLVKTPALFERSSAKDLQQFIVDNWALFGQEGDHEVLRFEPNENFTVFVVHRV